MRDCTEKEVAVNSLLELLAPVLTHHQGMAARAREQQFRDALEVLVGPTAPVPSGVGDGK